VILAKIRDMLSSEKRDGTVNIGIKAAACLRGRALVQNGNGMLRFIATDKIKITSSGENVIPM